MSKLLFVAGLLAAAAASVSSAAELRTIKKLHKKAADASSSSSASSLRLSDVGTWTDLFSPPYSNCPSVMMAISCMNPTNCYVPGGSNGVGFQMLQFNGMPGGTFTPMNMPSAPLMMMAIDMRGSIYRPGGAAGGMGFGNGLQYLANSTTWLPSSVDAIIDLTQDIRASQDGKRVLAVDASGTSDVWYSTTSGQSFSTVNLGVPLITSDTNLRYGAIPTANTWFLTAGTWPANNNDNVDGKMFDSKQRKQAHSFALSERVAVSRCPKTGNVKRNVRKIHKERLARAANTNNVNLGGNSTGYSAQIFRTTDGGKSFQSVFTSLTNFYFNAIDCTDAYNCYAVGEGFDANAGVHIYRTTDGGNSWNQVYFLPSTSEWSYSLMSIGVSHGTFIAAGGAEGSMTAQSLIITSTDGITWTQETPLPNIVDIADLDVIPGGYAFAAAMTVYDDSTILAFRPKGTPTLPPAPTQATFTQIDCSDAKCTQNCQSNTFAQGACLQINGGGSATVSCTATALVQTVYANSNSCTGNSTQQTQPLNTCLAANGGGYFENQCSGSSLF